MKNEYETVIIGAGVAGMTAALYLKRASRDCCIIESEAPGGQMNRTSIIENYPGFLKIEGPELSMNLFKQIQVLGVIYKYGSVIEIEDQGEQKVVKTNLEEIFCKNIIIATGRNPKKLEVEGENTYTNRGISWCAVCDGPLYKGKKVAVIGGGRAAVEEAIYLSNFCDTVTLIHRRDTFRVEETLVEKMKSIKNITILTEKEVKYFSGTNQKLSTIHIQNKTTKVEEKISVEGCFIYIGEIPNTNFITKKELLNSQNYIEVDSKMETKTKNIYACGDCVQKGLYQIVTAASEGAIAANQIIERATIA